MLSGIEGDVQLEEKPRQEDGKTIIITQQPVMECSLDILTELVRHKTVTLRARGESIPVAVAVANVVTENMLKGNSKILDIVVDSEDQGTNGPLVSVIEITIRKTN